MIFTIIPAEKTGPTKNSSPKTHVYFGLKSGCPEVRRHLVDTRYVRLYIAPSVGLAHARWMRKGLSRGKT